jgi:hypothetical protein
VPASTGGRRLPSTPFLLGSYAMDTDEKICVEARGDLLMVTQPPAQFFAIYVKPTDQPRLILKLLALSSSSVRRGAAGDRSSCRPVTTVEVDQRECPDLRIVKQSSNSGGGHATRRLEIR